MSVDVDVAREMKRKGWSNADIAKALDKPRWWVTDALYAMNRKPTPPSVAAALRDLIESDGKARANHDERAVNGAIRLHGKGERG